MFYYALLLQVFGFCFASTTLAFQLHHSNGKSYYDKASPLSLRVISPGEEARTSTTQESTTTTTTTTTLDVIALKEILTEGMHRVHFLMQTDYLKSKHCPYEPLRVLFQNCIDSVQVKTSSIPNAGRGLFATRDIAKNSIIAFYPMHGLGCKLEHPRDDDDGGGDGGGNHHSYYWSVQMALDPKNAMVHEESSYALFSLLGNLPFCGVNLEERFGDNARLFVDATPDYCTVKEGWYGGYINDSAIVKHLGDENYYPTSRSNQNIEIVPFYPAPFQVCVTTRDVKQGEEFFTSYGYNYWVNILNLQQSPSKPPESIVKQKEEAALSIQTTVKVVPELYQEAAWCLADLFQKLGPIAKAQSYPDQWTLIIKKS